MFRGAPGLFLLFFCVAYAQNDFTTSFMPTPTPPQYGEHYRPYFFNEHPNICGRMPSLTVTDKNNAKWDYYTELGGTLNIVYLVEAHCGTCQSNALVAGSLAKRWEDFGNVPRRSHLSVDIKVLAVNRDTPRDRTKFRMMNRKIRSVLPWVTLLQDNPASNVWDALGQFHFENWGDHGNETIKFKSRRNDFYMVDKWGRMIRFMRNGILNRARISGPQTNLNWRDVVHHDFILAKEGVTVCDELQVERLLCRMSEEWSLNGRTFRDLRSGTSLTILIFIRADMEEYTTRGLLADVISLSGRWSAPSYVVIVDSNEPSTSSFATVDLLKQTENADITLLLDEDNSVASKYLAAPGDVVATDELGRVIGLFNRANLADATTVSQLESLHVNWNPDCEAYTYATVSTASAPYYSTSGWWASGK